MPSPRRIARRGSPLLVMTMLLPWLGVPSPALGGAGEPAVAALPELPAASQQAATDVQALLDRVNFSPGVVDGSGGENTRKALAAFQEAHDLPVTGEIDALTWQNLLAASGGHPWTLATISEEDARGPFVSLPADLADQARLPALGYTSLVELLAERFHTSAKLLRERNPSARFVAGETLVVPNVRRVPTGQATAEEVRVVVSKSRLTLAVDNGDDLLFFAPVSAGSEHDPLPLGTFRVQGVERNPIAFCEPQLFWSANPKAGRVRLAPGPNNPLGAVWIDLSKDRYGIHGTPNPEKIGTPFARGGVRLTNWDALTVASLVKPGTTVVFEP
jgi:lipoprotein-anchoring transpeptidase ErfK/SrfK